MVLNEMQMFLQINETALNLESAPPPSPWMTSPRSVRHPATHTAVSRYSVRHLRTEVSWQNLAGNLCFEFMCILLQEFPDICAHDEGLKADVSRDVLYFYDTGNAVIREKEGESIHVNHHYLQFRLGNSNGDYF